MTYRPRGFSLVELLVVISIIALLIGILLPVLGASRETTEATIELAAARSLSQAYLGQSVDEGGEFLHGMVYSGKAFDSFGNEVFGVDRNRYPWRLAAYLDYQMGGSIFVNDQADLAQKPDSMSLALWQYQVGVAPSFGININNVGGHASPFPSIIPSEEMPGIVRRLEDSVDPSNLIVFASAREVDFISGGVVHGHFRVNAPNDRYSPWLNVPYTYEGLPSVTGKVDPRFNDRAVVSHLDGSGKLLTVDDLRDMTRWNNTAAELGDPDWAP